MITEEQKKQLEEEEEKISQTLGKIDHKIVVFSGKGGVGKTTVSVNLAYGLKLKNFKVGLLDADVTGPNVPEMIGMNKKLLNLDEKIIPNNWKGVEIVSAASMIQKDQPIIWRGPMRSKLLNQFIGDVEWGELDFLIADLSPGTGDEIITMTQKLQPDMAIIVTTPQSVSLLDSSRAINMAKKMKIPVIGLVENMSGLICPGCGTKINLFGEGGGKIQAEKFGIDFLEQLPIDLETRTNSELGMPIVLKNHNNKMAEVINNLVDKIVELLQTQEKLESYKLL
jgi:ATP-binding protein involved in chromosome partitioning